MVGLAIRFYDVVLFLHISSVIIGFGVTFSYPVLFAVAARADPRSMPAVMRAVDVIGSRIIGPSLGAIVATGLYLLIDGDWDAGDPWLAGVFVSVLMLGALGGVYFTPVGRRLIELADRDVAAAGDGDVKWSEEYERLQRQIANVGILNSVLVLVAVFLMTTKPGL